MIDINFENKTYTCPYCNDKQRFNLNDDFSECDECGIGSNVSLYMDGKRKVLKHKVKTLIYSITCNNPKCNKTTVIAVNDDGEQIDILPSKYQKCFPNYIPQPIIRDFQEGVSIINYSPRASAILFRKCLEGMIKNCFGVCEKKLYDSIDKIFKNNQISAGQKEMLDSIRRIGNICAHFQSEDNSLFDYTSDEVNKIKDVLEYLFEEWYIEPNRRKKLQEEISQMANKKEDKNEK